MSTVTDTSAEESLIIDGMICHRHINPDGKLGGWVADTASVADTVHIGKNAQVLRYAHVTGRVRIYGRVVITDWANVSDDAYLNDNARVEKYANVSGTARVREDALVTGNSTVTDDAFVCGRSVLTDRVVAKDTALVIGHKHSGRASLDGEAIYCGGTTDVESELERLKPLLAH